MHQKLRAYGAPVLRLETRWSGGTLLALGWVEAPSLDHPTLTCVELDRWGGSLAGTGQALMPVLAELWKVPLTEAPVSPQAHPHFEPPLPEGNRRWPVWSRLRSGGAPTGEVTDARLEEREERAEVGGRTPRDALDFWAETLLETERLDRAPPYAEVTARTTAIGHGPSEVVWRFEPLSESILESIRTLAAAGVGEASIRRFLSLCHPSAGTGGGMMRRALGLEDRAPEEALAAALERSVTTGPRVPRRAIARRWSRSRFTCSRIGSTRARAVSGTWTWRARRSACSGGASSLPGTARRSAW